MMRRRKLAVLAVLIVVVAIAYTGAWFYAAGAIRDRANAFIAGLTGEGIKAACVNLDVSGYPVAIGLTCERIDASDSHGGGRVEAGAFRSVAQFSHPGRVVSELDGPLQARAPDGYTVKADWNMLRSSAVLWFQGLMSGHLEVKKLTATVDGPLIPGPLDLTSPEMEARTRRDGADVDVDFTVHRLSLKGSRSLADLPAADVSGTATLSGMAPLLSGRKNLSNPRHLLRGRSGTLHNLTAKLAGGASFVVQGPFSFDDSGRLSGDFKLQIEGIEAWQRTVDKAIPDARNAIANAGKMLTAMAGGKDTATITLTASHGRLSLGLIPLGTLPPV